jgi:hypothetical protein
MKTLKDLFYNTLTKGALTCPAESMATLVEEYT